MGIRQVYYRPTAGELGQTVLEEELNSGRGVEAQSGHVWEQ